MDTTISTEAQLHPDPQPEPTVVDARDQSCPGPIVTLARALTGAGPGDLLELWATDPGSKSDIPAWAKVSGNQLLETGERDGVFTYLIQKK